MGGQLESKVAVITGAGRGIGRGLAIGFAEQGAKVVCAARTQAQLDKTVQDIRAAGGDAIAVRCDVTQAADLERSLRPEPVTITEQSISWSPTLAATSSGARSMRAR